MSAVLHTSPFSATQSRVAQGRNTQGRVTQGRVAESRRSTRAQAQFIRRRAMLIIAFVSVVGGGVFATGAVADKGAPAGSIEMPRTLTVQQGDTLWAIAHRLAPEGNVVSLVDALVRLNGDRIVAGQQIRLP